jgi:hypothetical protein
MPLPVWIGNVYALAMPARKPPDPNAKLKKPDPLDGLPRIERFAAIARELECDEDPAAFEAALRKIATAGPPKKYEPNKRAKPET